MFKSILVNLSQPWFNLPSDVYLDNSKTFIYAHGWNSDSGSWLSAADHPRSLFWEAIQTMNESVNVILVDWVKVSSRQNKSSMNSISSVHWNNKKHRGILKMILNLNKFNKKMLNKNNEIIFRNVTFSVKYQDFFSVLRFLCAYFLILTLSTTFCYSSKCNKITEKCVVYFECF